MLFMSVFLCIASWSTVNTQTPSKPRNVVVVNKTTNSVSFTWNKPTNPFNLTNYELYVKAKIVNLGSITQLTNGIPNPLAGSIGNLKSNTDYTLKICARVNNTVGAWSDEVDFRTAKLPSEYGPSKPLNVYAIYIAYANSTFVQTALHLNWSRPLQPRNLTKYQVQISLKGVVKRTYNENIPNSLATVSLVLGQEVWMKPDMMFDVQIRGMNNNTGDWSDKVQFTVVNSEKNGSDKKELFMGLFVTLVMMALFLVS